MYYFVTWVIEYSEDEWLARLLFILSLPLLLVAKVLLRIGEGFSDLFKRSNRQELVPVATGARGRMSY